MSKKEKPQETGEAKARKITLPPLDWVAVVSWGVTILLSTAMILVIEDQSVYQQDCRGGDRRCK